jgi:deoxyinosine 3'endonuclease (endonuclease V)
MAKQMAVPSDSLQQQWKLEQNDLKTRLVLEDQLSVPVDDIRLVGGVDISFIKGDNVNACASLVVVELPSLKVTCQKNNLPQNSCCEQVVYERHSMVQLTEPYISGFLAFREVNHLVTLVHELQHDTPSLVPEASHTLLQIRLCGFL